MRSTGMIFLLSIFIAPLQVIASAGIVPTHATPACSATLNNISTVYMGSHNLCEIRTRYLRAMDQLKAEGVANPERIANLRAPRFINYPDWVSLREKNNYNPWTVYQPAPKTWQTWENGIEYLQQTSIRSQPAESFTVQWLLDLHKASMNGQLDGAGALRKSGEVGLALQRRHAITALQAQVLEHGGGYDSLVSPGRPLFLWQPTVCWEDLSPEIKNQQQERSKSGTPNSFYPNEWTPVERTSFFKDADGNSRQCGYISYIPPENVPAELRAWSRELQSLVRDIDQGVSSEDIFVRISRIERLFIGIHPFSDGNGRTSRFIVEMLLARMGLPPVIFANMDNDIYLSEDQWAREIGSGLLRTLEIGEGCARNPNDLGCTLVPTSSPVMASGK